MNDSEKDTQVAQPKKASHVHAEASAKAGDQVLFVLDDGLQRGAIRPAVVVEGEVDRDRIAELAQADETDSTTAETDTETPDDDYNRADLHVFSNGLKDYPQGHAYLTGPHNRYDVRYDADKSPNSWHFAG